MKTKITETDADREARLVRLRTRTPHGEWLGAVVPEDGAKFWVAWQTEEHPTNFAFDYLPLANEAATP